MPSFRLISQKKHSVTILAKKQPINLTNVGLLGYFDFFLDILVQPT